MDSAPPSLAPGRVLAQRWRIVSYLGGGSMGTVYVVAHGLSGDEGALKVMRPGLLSDPDLQRRFRREAMVTTAVDHQNVVRVLDVGSDDELGVPFYVMERLHGLDAQRRLAARGPGPWEETLLLLAQAAAALDYAHALDILHRDVNPKNLFVTTDEGGALRVKMLDFGLAKIVAEGPDAPATLAAGTPLYMSPEQLGGDGNIDAACDRYALAHLAHTLLTGRAYWQDEFDANPRPMALSRSILQGLDELPTERAARHGVVLPEAYDAWLGRATRHAPSERFPSCTALVDALSEVLDLVEARPRRASRRPPAVRAELDERRCVELLERAVGGDDQAWQTLVAELWPFWLRVVRGHRAMGQLGREEDHVNDVVARLVEKLSPRGGGALGTYADWARRNPDKAFGDWLRILTVFAVRDHVRKTLGRGRRDDPDLPPPKRLLNEFALSEAFDEANLGFRPSFTAAQLARQLIDFGRERLRPEQLEALVRWLQGADYAEIAEALPDADVEQARRELRSAVATLRRRFAGE